MITGKPFKKEAIMTPARQKIVALAGLALVLAAGAWAQTPDADKVLGQSAAGVVGLVIYGQDKAEMAKGSAMALGEDIVATAYNIVSRAYDVEALTSKGKKIKIDGIVAIDKVHDIALLKLKGKVQPLTLTTAGPEALAAGTRIFALGTNESGQITVSEGTMRRFLEVGPGLKVMDMSLAVPVPFAGGPIVDLDGRVVGMTVVLDPDRGTKIGLPAAVVQTVIRSGQVTPFKSLTRENYFDTFEGASLAGLTAAALDELMAARSNLEKAVKMNPSFLEGFWVLGNVYDKQRDLAAAADAYRKVTEMDGSKAEAFHRLGTVLMKMSKYGEAAAAMEKAISMNIDNKEVYFELGTVYEELQDSAKAAQAYERFISLKPEVAWNGYLRLGICRTKLEQYDAAIAAFLEALKEQPKDLNVNFKLAEAYEKAGRLDKAEQVYDTLATINPGEAKSYYGQAIRMYDAAGQYAKAVGPARKIVDLEPNNELNIYNLALMYFKLEDYDQAIAAFKQVLALKPDLANAWFQIGASYYQQKKYKEAAEAYKTFTEMSPDEPNGWLSMGVCYMFLKAWESALPAMKKAVDLKPDNPNALYNLAIVYLNLHDTYSAKDIYNKLVSLDPATAEKLKKFIR
jgi:tetratricopeptide (TPR) repeat protein